MGQSFEEFQDLEGQNLQISGLERLFAYRNLFQPLISSILTPKHSPMRRSSPLAMRFPLTTRSTPFSGWIFSSSRFPGCNSISFPTVICKRPTSTTMDRGISSKVNVVVSWPGEVD